MYRNGTYPQSAEKVQLELSLFLIDMVEWVRVMKDAGTRENGSRPGRVCGHRPTGAEGAFTAKDRCIGGLHTAVLQYNNIAGPAGERWFSVKVV